MCDVLSIRTAALAEIKHGFDNHVVVREGGGFTFQEPGTFVHRCFVTVNNVSGVLTLTGDLGDLILYTGGSPLGFLRGTLGDNRKPGQHSYNYIFEKVSRQMTAGFLTNSIELLKRFCEETLTEVGLPPLNDDGSLWQDAVGKVCTNDEQAQAWMLANDLLSLISHSRDNPFSATEAYDVLSRHGVDDYPSLKAFTKEFYWLVEALRVFIVRLDQTLYEPDEPVNS